MAVKSGPGSVWRRLLPILFDILGLALVVGAVSGPGWFAIPGSISIETSKAPSDPSASYSPDIDIYPVVTQIGIFTVCIPNTTETVKDKKQKAEGVEQVCADDYQDAYDKFTVDPWIKKTRPTWETKDDSMQAGAKSMALIAVLAAAVSVVFRVFHFLGWFKSCPASLRPGALVTLSDTTAAVSAFGVTGVVYLSAYMYASPYSWTSLLTTTIFPRYSNDVTYSTGALAMGPSFAAANTAGILFATAAIDGLWGLHAPVRRGGRRKGSKTDEEEDDEESR